MFLFFAKCPSSKSSMCGGLWCHLRRGGNNFALIFFFGKKSEKLELFLPLFVNVSVEFLLVFVAHLWTIKIRRDAVNLVLISSCPYSYPHFKRYPEYNIHRIFSLLFIQPVFFPHPPVSNRPFEFWFSAVDVALFMCNIVRERIHSPPCHSLIFDIWYLISLIFGAADVEAKYLTHPK